MAAEAKYKPQLPRATHKGMLKLPGMKIPCFVLDDGRRVISGRGMTMAIGMKGRGQGIARIAGHRMFETLENNTLAMAIQTAILRPLLLMCRNGFRSTASAHSRQISVSSIAALLAECAPVPQRRALRKIARFLVR